MATLDSLQFEMERRVILFKPTTTMPDLSQLGYNADPNLIIVPSTPGETLLYNCPNNTRYVNYDASGNTIQEWYKHSQPNYWLPLGGVSGVFVKESSLGDGLVWDVSGFLDVSINVSPSSILTYDGSIEGNDATTIFPVIHNLNTMRQNIEIWDYTTNETIYPAITKGSSTNYVSFYTPPSTGSIYNITIIGF